MSDAAFAAPAMNDAEHERTIAVAKILAKATAERKEFQSGALDFYSASIRQVRLSPDDEINALKRLREALGV